MDTKVRKCALDLQDTVLLAKLSAGDMISQDALYHLKCLTSLYNRTRNQDPLNMTEVHDRRLQGIALAEIIAFIDESRRYSEVAPVFKLADLAEMYTSKLNELGVKISGRVHTTDLKNRILANIPDMKAYKQGRDILMVFDEDVGMALRNVCERDFDNEAMILSQAASIVRKDIFENKTVFNGSFETAPIVAFDQPLYAIAKNIQWNWPNRYGEDHVVVMLGGLHIEMAVLKTIGDWLDGSGWTTSIVQASIASSGTADSFLKASHVTRTRHAHQITAGALHCLMYEAYNTYLGSVEEGIPHLEFQDWRKRREEESPQFHYWSITLKFELAILIFVRSLREGNFELYRDSITSLAPWFFALNHQNYARWLSIHIRDMMSLPKMHPEIAQEFSNGHFVVHKSNRIFSAIPIDQAHEQNNKCVKGDGGAIGLTENTSQLLRWMVSGPEMARIIGEFESSIDSLMNNLNDDEINRHHEQTMCVQSTFRKQVKALCHTIEGFGSPFMDTSDELLVLDSHDIADPRVIETVKSIEKLGQEQYNTFVDERLKKKTKSVFEPIKRNKLSLFSSQPIRTVSKDKQQIASLKQNCSLFSQLYVSCQVRDSDLDAFFKHENQSYPPSLSQFGTLRLGCKADLLDILEDLSTATKEAPDVDVLLLDGAAVVNMIKPGASKTFKDYSQTFQSYLKRQLRNVTRLDVVWDRYVSDSLKSAVRTNRGQGQRRRVSADTRLPSNWSGFLRVDENKTELFSYLADQSMLVDCGTDKYIVSTKESEVLCNATKDLSGISPCSHEEADTRILLHASDAAKQGHKKVMIRTVDTDVVVLAVALYHQLQLNELWIAFGAGKNLRYLAAHVIAGSLGLAKSRALPAFHAFSGCDQISSFAGRGKETAWDAWRGFEDVTPVFENLSQISTESSIRKMMPVIERFVIIMYDRGSMATDVNKARKELFTQKGRPIESIPPTYAALFEHTKRTAFQAGYCWGQSLVSTPNLPEPNQWGWIKGTQQKWEPYWSSLPQASKCCQELLKCGCSADKGCKGRCKCAKAQMMCTALCKCGGHCKRD